MKFTTIARAFHVDHRDGRLGQDAHRRPDDFELVGAEFVDRQERRVFPRDQHVAVVGMRVEVDVLRDGYTEVCTFPGTEEPTDDANALEQIIAANRD